ncbi:hypothetical protein HG536_0C00280 [Torulaspora globosa]|uniref:Uncharacterized protein n=1 Tax=Torulaspora globosa TaxID=48254 RepID=A0A7G3ZEC5_9SACH|nr:uncharacterized protein HG536_0C00280 [Torulaspora globosa]QLL31861.1 hypothetical protein HG536_0C00280 [Torulaspora globosa]
MERKAKSGKTKKSLQFDPLDITESLGYKTYRKSGRNSWSKQDDNELRSLLSMALVELGYANGTDDIKSIQESEQACKKVSWEDIAARFKNSHRKPKELRKRWTSSLDPNLKRGKWDPDEDELLLKAYAKHGSHWLNVASEISGRTEDQCAKRYVEILGPSSEGRLRAWTLEEDLSLVSKVKSYGTKWRRISSELESRPSLTCRNRWRKIITSIVRGQAPPEIVKAVNENQDIDSLVNSLRAKEREKGASKKKAVKAKEEREDHDQEIDGQEGDQEEFGPLTDSAKFTKESPRIFPQVQQSMFTQKDQGFADDTPTTSKEEVHKSLSVDAFEPLLNHASKTVSHGEVRSGQTPHLHQQQIPYSSQSPDNTTGEKMSSNGRTSSLDGRKSSTSLKDSTPFGGSMNHISSELTRSPMSTTLDGSALIPKVYTKESSIRISQNPGSDQRVSDTTFDPAISNTSHDLNKNFLHNTGQTDWKFTLKDGQGLSISSGSISNSALVKELIEQAKKYSLKISLHQHIHYHYGGQNDSNCINTNSMEPIATLQPNPISADLSMGPSSTANDLFTGSHYYKASYGSISQHHDLFAQEPSYNSFDLDPSPQPNGNQDFYPNQAVQHTHSPAGYPNRPGTTSSIGSHSTGNNDDAPDIGRNRVSHFNYLPSSVRPQLGSSDSTRAADLSRLLNPSPNNGNSKKKKKRTRSFPSETAAASGTTFRESVRPPPSSPASKHTGPSDNTAGISVLYEEEGLDFWEYLRSLAGKPTAEEEKLHPYHPYGEGDYDILCSLFDGKVPDVRPKSVQSEVKRSPASDGDSAIPFNPS